MKKILPLIAMLMLVMVAWRLLGGLDVDDWHINWNGKDVDGPLGALGAVVFAGGGLLAGLLGLALAALCVGLLFAGLGLLLVAGLALLALLLAACLTPFLLPLLIPLAILLFIAARMRRRPN